MLPIFYLLSLFSIPFGILLINISHNITKRDIRRVKKDILNAGEGYSEILKDIYDWEEKNTKL